MGLTFTALLALFPLVAYWGTLGAIRVSGHALVTTAGRDTAALAVAVSGLFAIGPAELFFPANSAAFLGPWVWVPLAVLYSLCVSLYILVRPQRLVVYGRSSEELYEALVRAAQQIDSGASGDPETLLVRLPAVGAHLRLVGPRGRDPVEVASFEWNLPPKFWSALLAALREEVRQIPASTPRPGMAMLSVAVALGGYLLWQGISHRALVVEGFRDWLWR